MLHVQDVEPAHLEVEGHLEAPRLDQLEDPLVSRTSPWRCSVGRRARRPTARHVQSTARPEARGRMVSQLRTYGKRYSDFKRRLTARRSPSPLAGSHSPSPFPLAAARLPLALSHGATGIFAGATGPFPKRHSAFYTGESLHRGQNSRNRLGARRGNSRGRLGHQGGASRRGGRRLTAASRPGRGRLAAARCAAPLPRAPSLPLRFLPMLAATMIITTPR